MSSIKRLQRSVHNSLHSSIILFDLPRVVEELTYNSVDAGSTKVYVSLSVRACYVKVEDDGCGITRDGLVILGEQYATSKNHLMAGTEASSESLGIRGEALASLSDVSLVEVRTKARGNPNAYCKIMKGSKCLFLGIDDHREAVGTTVIVRDLFYNQPVRRKYMQSSPKKVLHSVKKCILRIALVHPELSFKVTDTDIEAELLCTVPSSSPLPLVSDGFGCEVSNSLHEIVFSDQTWRLAGYLSGPADFFSSKAFQYLYINSRFVSKGSIHNLLNSLGARSSSSLVQRKVNPEFSSGKRHKSQGYPAYLLNLRCPLSCYDITYEPSKTVAEFKDWDAVLSFFERAITHFWQQRPTISLHGKPINHENILHSESELQKNEFLRSSKTTRKRKCNIQFHQNSPLSSCLDISSENVNVRHGKTLRGMHRSLELKQCQTSRHGQTAYSVGKKIQDSEDALASPHAQLDFPNSNTHLWTPDVNSFPPECHSVSDHPISVKRKYDISPIEWERECPGDCRNLKDDSTSDPYGIIDDAQEEEFLLACPNGFSKVDREIYSLMENEQNSSIYDKNFGDSDFDHFEKDFLLGDAVDVSYGSYSTETLKYRDTLFEGDLHTSGQRSFNVTGKFHTARKPDVLTNYSVSPFSHDEVCLPQNNYLSNRLGWTVSSIYGFHEAEIHLGLSDSFSSSVDNFTEGCASRDNLRLFSGIDSSDSDVEEKFDFLHSIQNCSVEVPPSTRHTNTKLDYKYRNTPRRDMQYGCPSKVNLGELPSSGILSDRDWSLDSPNMKSIDSYDNSFFNFTVKNVGDVVETQWAEEKFENCRSSKIKKVRSRRSCSAPPFYKGTRKFVILNGHLSTVEGKGPLSECSKDAKMSEDNTNTLDYLSQPYCASQPCLQPTLGDASMKHLRGCIDEKLSSHEVNGMQNVDGSDNVRHNRSSHTNAVEGSTYDDWEHAPTTLTKWRPGVPQPTVGDMSYPNPKHKDDILDISSGLLHLSGGSLVPESIDKDNLEDARVLLQLDKKFIPVMARGTLVIIDQHAADERIRLEELRRKVLSGEGNSITYLDSELELVLPEMGFQLLQKYAEQVKKWGWICSIHSQCSQESFAKNVNLLKRRACGATLVAVPCILGIDLTDKDLIEFIEQLVETDGSSTLPPSVLRILNYKACRGAIMFGDSLLPSECSLIVEELKATSLCFQCAHGRPTTVPLLNMKALYEQLDKLDMQSGRPEEVWHGLRQHAPTLERARMRLESAKRFHNG